MAPPSDSARLERLPAFAWSVILVVALSVAYTIIDVAFVRPYLWPAGSGATFAGDPATQVPLKARPPSIADGAFAAATVDAVAPHSPAAAAGLTVGLTVAEVGTPERPA